MTPSEEWRPIPGALDYEISNLGKVRSFSGRHGERRDAPRLRKLHRDTTGYWQIAFRHDDGVRRSRPVHVLVALTFIGPRPTGLEVRHLDGVKDNNRLSNLTYGTHVENSRDAIQHGTHISVLRAAATHCANGHEYTPENTRINKPKAGTDATSRSCRTCVRINGREAARRRRAAEVIRPDEPSDADRGDDGAF